MKTNMQLVGGLAASRQLSKDEAAASDPSRFGSACAVEEYAVPRSTNSRGTHANAA